MQIKPYRPEHLEAVVRLSLRAWAPVFESIATVMDTAVFDAFHPEGWRVSQREGVKSVCNADDVETWVAVEAEAIAGFVSVKLHTESGMGEIYMVAVDPDFQGRGIGMGLTEFALDWMKEPGMAVAMVETGGDPGHGPARRTYEKAGFGLFPIARYFKKL